MRSASARCTSRSGPRQCGPLPCVCVHRHVPYEMGQTRQRYDFTIHVPVPAKTKAGDCRVKIKEKTLKVLIATHPLQPVIDGELYKEIHVSGSGCEWHLEGEFETRRFVLDLEKKRFGNWPCLMLAEAPEEPPPVPRKVVSGAAGEVDVYEEEGVRAEEPAVKKGARRSRRLADVCLRSCVLPGTTVSAD